MKALFIGVVCAIVILGSFVLGYEFGSNKAVDRYWVGGTGYWSDDDNHWAMVSGGVPANGNLPGSNSSVHFDDNSDIDGTPFAVMVEEDVFCADISWSGIDVQATFKNNASTVNIYGSLTVEDGHWENGEQWVKDDDCEILPENQFILNLFDRADRYEFNITGSKDGVVEGTLILYYEETKE